MPKTEEKNRSMRLDKWLWCARFYKTRGLASEAIKNGKVLVADKRIKPSRNIIVGDTVNVRHGALEYTITINALAGGRKSAKEASLLYEESAASIRKREKLAEQIKMNAMYTPQTRGKPTKRDRRELIRFKNRT